MRRNILLASFIGGFASLTVEIMPIFIKNFESDISTFAAELIANWGVPALSMAIYIMIIIIIFVLIRMRPIVDEDDSKELQLSTKRQKEILGNHSSILGTWLIGTKKNQKEMDEDKEQVKSDQDKSPSPVLEYAIAVFQRNRFDITLEGDLYRRENGYEDWKHIGNYKSILTELSIDDNTYIYAYERTSELEIAKGDESDNKEDEGDSGDGYYKCGSSSGIGEYTFRLSFDQESETLLFNTLKGDYFDPVIDEKRMIEGVRVACLKELKDVSEEEKDAILNATNILERTNIKALDEIFTAKVVNW